MEDYASRDAGKPGERVVVGRARVDHDRLPELGGKLELGGEEAALAVARRVVAVPVEPGLADRNRLRMAEQLAQLREIGFGRGARLVRVDAEDREDAVVPLGELERPAAVFHVGADREYARDTRLGGTLDGLVRVLERAEVRVRVDHAAVVGSTI